METGKDNRPQITLAYAQSLDGSLAARRGEPLAISGPEALRVTHQLRATHDAILVGIGTVLADDPRLTVRRVVGEHPQPIILDSQLRFPLAARLMGNPKKPWIVTTRDYSAQNLGEQFETKPAHADRWKMLESQGAKVLAVAPGPDGRVDLFAMLLILSELGIRTLMVEGGAQVIGAFLKAKLVDEAVLTLAPIFVGGLHALETPLPASFPRLHAPTIAAVGSEWVVRGKLIYEA
ncbi:MAG: RibD family protein [Anaerolineales bacterium]|nr:RibD family protein [Anaerolineales bacterium]